MIVAQVADVLMDDFWGATAVTLVAAGSLCGCIALGYQRKGVARCGALIAVFVLFLSLLFPLSLRNLIVIATVLFSLYEIAQLSCVLIGRFLRRMVANLTDDG